MLKKSIIVHLKIKSLFQMYEIVNTRLEFLVLMKATQLKYLLKWSIVFLS